ncbi:MAG: phage holin family protein [Flavobacteriales bacterium]|nr:phage holin family protein [Flavobacteriales bacterium]
MKLNDQIEGAVKELEGYVEARIEHTRLETVEKATNTLSTVLGWIGIAAIAFVFTLLVTVMAIVLLEQLTGGFLTAILIVSSFYLILLILMSKFREKILIVHIKNMILGIYLKDENQK